MRSTSGSPHEAAGQTSWLFFDVAGARLAIPATSVEEIMELGVVTPVPLAPASIRGLMNLRGEALPLLDLGLFFQLDAADSHRTVVACRTSSFRVGLLCDRARGIRQVPTQEQSPPRLARPARLRELAQAEIEVEGGFDVLLDLDAVLEAARVRA